MLMYAQDFDGKIYASCAGCGNPPHITGHQGDGGAQALSYYYPYMKNEQLYQCPSEEHRYCYGQVVWNPTAGGMVNSGKPLDKIAGDNTKGPAGVIIITEGWNVFFWDWGDADGKGSLFPRIGEWHNQGVNCAYVDGHVKWQKKASLNTADFGDVPPGINQ